MIEVITSDAVIENACASFGIAPGDAGLLDESYLAAALRRLAGFLCPCSPKTVLRAMVESHLGLVSDAAAFSERVETIIETLVFAGDLLELADIALEGDATKSTWLVAAPPAFVARESGSVFILGLSADEQTPLPIEMRSRMSLRRTIRSIDPSPGEDLAAALRGLGLRELSNTAWIRCPRAVNATALVAAYDTKLAAQRSSGDIPDLSVLNWSRKTRSYRARWTGPEALTGQFVVRRPQTFGANLWGYAQLRDGVPLKLLDLPLHGERWRGCDVAWRIQMAIDSLAGRPQEYRLRAAEDGARFDFFSPIPNWARRRLTLVGEEVDTAGCLMSFLVPAREVAAKERFLSQLLYLSRAAE
ncbi:hypothetical protein [Methylobacterium sp. 1030]|uniref:hypothetical protein n=1 Tax=Methylobacterium sp. 1030 TaxID=3156404 RepID=UPI0033922D31